MKHLTSKLPPMGTLGPFIALVCACLFFATQSDRFLTLQNFSLILQQVMVVGTIAIGMVVRAAFGGGVAISFVVVATLVTGALLLGWPTWCPAR